AGLRRQVAERREGSGAPACGGPGPYGARDLGAEDQFRLALRAGLQPAVRLHQHDERDDAAGALVDDPRQGRAGADPDRAEEAGAGAAGDDQAERQGDAPRAAAPVSRARSADRDPPPPRLLRAGLAARAAAAGASAWTRAAAWRSVRWPRRAA